MEGHILRNEATVKQRDAERSSECAALEVTAQPTIVVVSLTPKVISSTRIVVNDTTYFTTRSVRTVDLSFKLHTACGVAVITLYRYIGKYLL